MSEIQQNDGWDNDGANRDVHFANVIPSGKNKPDISSASDYALFESKNLQAYYGYESTDENEDWCFQAKVNNDVIKIPFKKLQGRDQFNCTENLLLGIGWLLAKYKLQE